MGFELYYLEEADSICSNRVVVTLTEKGVDWVPHRMSLMKREQFTPEYIALNPNAEVPTLVHDGEPIRDSSVICRYLDDVIPEPSLSPREPVQRARLLEWIKHFDERGFEATATINFLTKFRLTLSIDDMRKRWKSVRSVDRLYRQQSVIKDGPDSPYVMRAIGAWETVFRRMEETLSDGRPWIMGEQFTLAETLGAPFIKVLEMTRFLEFWLDDYPHVRQWWERVADRPSMRQLDEFPDNAVSEDSRHAVSGRESAPAFREKLQQYRAQFAHGQ